MKLNEAARIDRYSEDGKFKVINDCTAPAQERYVNIALNLPTGIANKGAGFTLKSAMRNLQESLLKSMSTVNECYLTLDSAINELNGEHI